MFFIIYTNNKQEGNTMDARKLSQLGGYIVDTPNIDFVRCDGTVFSYDEVSTASMSNTKNNITITGGQGAYPLAYIDTDSTSEVTFASAQFSLDMFEMTQNVKQKVGSFGTRESARFEVDAEHKITIPYELKEKSVFIRDMAEGTAAAAGTYTVTANNEGDEPSTVITFAEGDFAVGDSVRVSYVRRVNDSAKLEIKTNSTSAKGELFAHWPVYSDGTDCADAAVKGWLHMHIPRCRVTALPGFDNSYKSASTNSVTFAAIDAKRADKVAVDWIYEPTNADGTINTAAGEGNVEW